MLQKYWASTVIFIGIFSQCIKMLSTICLCKGFYVKKEHFYRSEVIEQNTIIYIMIHLKIN